MQQEAARMRRAGTRPALLCTLCVARGVVKRRSERLPGSSRGTVCVFGIYLNFSVSRP
jgi:hypothetical protein